MKTVSTNVAVSIVFFLSIGGSIAIFATAVANDLSIWSGLSIWIVGTFILMWSLLEWYWSNERQIRRAAGFDVD